MNEITNRLLRALPKVDECLELIQKTREIEGPRNLIKIVVQKVIKKEREAILLDSSQCQNRTNEEWVSIFKVQLDEKLQSNLKALYNGTGVVVHTNLGRSVLSRATTDCLMKAGGYYSNLEFNLETGKRGSRYSLVEEILCDLTGAEAAIVVNNNAAAVLIALETLARDKEVIVSRGQLVEIGGSFRIPDVMAKSGAYLVEVGATNRTHLRDYENAITEETVLLLRVHTSNFKIIGFTSEVGVEEMVALAGKKNLVTMEDLGSGSLIDFSRFGFPQEPTVQEIIKAGVDVVTFSGDKLLGGPQAGIIIGKKDVIEKIKSNPLNRALRIDKFTLASLESVLREYYDMDQAIKNIPTLSMLTIAEEELKKRAQRIRRRLNNRIKEKCFVKIIATHSMVGGGALPEFRIPSWAVVLKPLSFSLNFLEKNLRMLSKPVIGRIENENYLLDVRTIQDHEITGLVEVLTEYFFNGDTSA